MLSRMPASLARDVKQFFIIGRSCSSVTKVLPSDVGVRDEVNFPHPKRPLNNPKVRMGFIPDNWFQFFYKKTGVTGPYVFGISFITFLVSKEIYVLEHEFWNGVTLAAIIIYSIKKFGPRLSAYLDKELEAHENLYEDYKKGTIKDFNSGIEAEKDAQWRAQVYTTLFDAKRENIGIQLENEYRDRLINVHSEVKNKLDYQLELSNIKTRFEQRHMTNWIIDNVRKAITPTQEGMALKQCLVDLKGIGQKA